MSENNNQGDTSEDDVCSQPIFTEEQNITSPTFSAEGFDDFIENSEGDTDNMSQSLLEPANNNKRKYVPQQEIQAKEDTCSDNQNASNSKKKKCERSDDKVNDDDNRCIHCTFDQDLDKRNYYFGNLLIGELQFLPPCMRSEAYITILKYIQTLKHKHNNI